MGNLFSGSSKTTTNSTTNTGPSQFQSPYLTDAFNSAQANYKAQAGTPYYTGETYAGMGADAKQSLDNLKGYAAGTGLGTASQLSSLGSSLTGNAGKAGNTLDQYIQTATTDPTQANIADAAQYANNPQLNGEIDAASRDVVRNLNEQTLPGIDRAASLTGNLNSSRAGVAQGIAERGAADRVADISSQMRGQAYDQGLTRAQEDRSQELGALANGAQGYQGLTQTGMSALNDGTQTGYGAYGQIAGANAAEQADRQGQDTANFNRWQGQDTRASDLLQRYYQIIGSNQWGQSGTSSGTQTQQSNPSILSQLLGAASTAAGAYMGFKN